MKEMTMLKTRARMKLYGHHTLFGIIVFLYLLLALVCQMLPAMFFTNTSGGLLTVSYLVLIYLMSIMTNMLFIGIMYIARCVVRDQSYSTPDLFYGFRNNSNQFILIQMIITAVGTALSIPSIFLIGYPEEASLQSYMIYLCHVLLYSVASQVITTLLTLRLKMSAFVIMDNPKLDTLSVLKKTFALAKGNYLKLLLLQISFILEYILSLFSFFTGFVLVHPYIQTAHCMLYEKFNQGQ